MIGQDQDDEVVKNFRVSRIRSEIRFATRRERDFRFPADFDVEEFRGRADWQFGDVAGEARVEVAPDTAWWVAAASTTAGGTASRTTPSSPSTRRCRCSRAGSCARTAARSRSSRPRCAGSPSRAPAPRAARTRARRPIPAASGAREAGARRRATAPAGPVAPERFGVLQSLLAYLLAACGEEREAVIPARELVERFSIPPEALEEHLSLLNLVNFGGGCYAVYAELHGDEVHVDKELFGDTFRGPPRLTPLEARAIRLALEFVGPMIAAGAHSPLDRVRAKLEETFGVVRARRGRPTPQGGAEEDLVATLTRAIAEHTVVELEYLKPESTEVTTRTVEPYTIERRLPHWYVHTWDVDRDAPRSYRLDRTRKAKALRARLHAARRLRPRRAAAHDDAPASGTRPRSPAGRSRRARSPLVDGAAVSERRGREPGVARSARCSRSAARRSCSSRPSCAARVRRPRARELERELRPPR